MDVHGAKLARTPGKDSEKEINHAELLNAAGSVLEIGRGRGRMPGNAKPEEYASCQNVT